MQFDAFSMVIEILSKSIEIYRWVLNSHRIASIGIESPSNCIDWNRIPIDLILGYQIPIDLIDGNSIPIDGTSILIDTTTKNTLPRSCSRQKNSIVNDSCFLILTIFLILLFIRAFQIRKRQLDSFLNTIE